MVVCFAAPWATRILLLEEKALAVGTGDVRGFVADATVALGIVGLLGVLLRPRWAWGRVLAWIALGAFLTGTFAIHEFIAVFDSLHAFGHVGFFTDATFVGGSVRHMEHPLWFGALLAAGSAGVALARAPTAPWWQWWAGAFGVIIFLHAATPVSHTYVGWRQRHAIFASASTLPVGAGRSAATVGAEAREAFTADLQGERWLGPLSGRPSLILILIEGASGASLPSVAARARLKSLAPMPKLDTLAQEHILFPHVVSHQRQTNRGEYAILCGDYPKLLTDQSKMTEQVYGEARRCLPAVLRDTGYATAYIQAAPLGFMLKDQFMRKAGFEELIGDDWFEDGYTRTDWGVDDKAFFEQALHRIQELHDDPRPFFATLLTVGTHHPFTFPDGDAVEGIEERRARAFLWADDALSAFLSQLESRGVLRDTIVIITSDESAGLVKTSSSAQRLLAQSWSFALIMLPEPRAKRVDDLYAHVDLALSITDLLGIEQTPRHFTGRSWFRNYESPRKLFAGNTYARRLIMWQAESAVICDEALRTCDRHGQLGRSPFKVKKRAEKTDPRERQLLAEVARLTRSGRPTMAEAAPMALLTAAEVEIPASEGKKLLTGGQYLRVEGGTVLGVKLDVEASGPDAEIALHHDVFVDGREKFQREGVRLRDGQRWRLSYEIGVPKDSGKLVVQLYATTVSGERAKLLVHDAQLRMRTRDDVESGVVVIADVTSDAAE